jgi:hypothetical protein
MKVSFSKTKTADAPTPPETALALVDKPDMQVAPANPVQSAQLDGEFTPRDVAVPRLKLGQKTGAATDENPDLIGKWIFDGAVNLGPQVNVIVTRISKYYMEDIEYGSEQKPQIFKKHADAVAAGVLVKDVADIDLLIQVPDDADLPSAVLLGDKEYAAARYTVQSSAYGRTVGILLRDLAGWLKGDFASGAYTMDTVKKTDGKNSWFTPSLKTAGPVPAETRTAIREMFGV